MPVLAEDTAWLCAQLGLVKPVSEVILRVRALVKGAPPRKTWWNINETILEVIALTRSEAQRSGVSIATHLSSDLPPVLGDRIQLQQVILSLLVNAIEAMSEVDERPRELLVGSRKHESNSVLVAVRDSGRRSRRLRAAPQPKEARSVPNVARNPTGPLPSAPAPPCQERGMEAG